MVSVHRGAYITPGFRAALIQILVAVVFAEAASFGVWHLYISDMRHRGVFRVKEIIEDKSLNHSQTIVSHPYSLYWNNPSFEDEYGRQYDDHGYRSHKYERKPNETRILVLGGSTTNMYPYIKDPQKIWTAELERLLIDKMGRPVHVFNAGLPFGTSAELMIHLLQNGRFLNPDLIIYHGGGNDVAPLMFPNYKTDYSHFRKSTAAGRRPFEKVLLTFSHVSRLVYVVWLKEEGVYSGQPYEFSEVPRSQAVSLIEGNNSPAFKNNVEVMVREGISLGAKVLLVGYLQAREENLSRNRKDLEGLEKAWILGVEKHHKIMSEIAAHYGQAFLKLEQDKFRDEWFVDNCHLNEIGEKEKARQVFEIVFKLLAEQGAGGV